MNHPPPGAPDSSVWVDGDMMFQVEGVGSRPARLVKVRRPFALIGRSAPCDIVLDDGAVNGQHVYLHQDERGVFAVDLATRAGTRINGQDRLVGWLRPGDWIEAAGYRVELVRARVKDADPPTRTPHDDDDAMLSASPRADLPRVTLEPFGTTTAETPWVLSSELVFLGGSAACGIRVRDPDVARAHCAIVRAASGVFLVDLCDGPSWVEDEPVRPSGALPLHDGDLITLGTSRFSVRIAASTNKNVIPPAHPRDDLPAQYRDPVEIRSPSTGLAEIEPRLLALDPEGLAPEIQNALLAWMVGTVQGGQGEVLRRQGEFQQAMTLALRQIQQDNATLLNAHLSRLENIDRELVALRAEIGRRGESAPPAAPSRMLPPPPDVTPLNIPRPAPAAPANAQGSTAWLLHRVSQLEAEGRSTWKDMLSRVPTPSAKRGPSD